MAAGGVKKGRLFSSELTSFFEGVGELSRFTVKVFREGLRPPFEFRELINQCFELGVMSFVFVAFIAFILGLVLILQTRPALLQFGAGAFLPALSSVSIAREIGPLVTALICAGKMGSRISAELGSMKVTEQIDAMDVSGTNPFKYLIATRVLATTLTIPILTIYADFISLLGAFVGANIKEEQNFTFFFSRVFDRLTFVEIIPALIKSFFFGFAIGMIGCSKGYNSSNGTEGVGLAVNSAVVVSMLAIIIIDMIVTQITSILGYL